MIELAKAALFFDYTKYLSLSARTKLSATTGCP
jgi:hypothetical protein